MIFVRAESGKTESRGQAERQKPDTTEEEQEERHGGQKEKETRNETRADVIRRSSVETRARFLGARGSDLPKRRTSAKCREGNGRRRTLARCVSLLDRRLEDLERAEKGFIDRHDGCGVVELPGTDIRRSNESATLNGQTGQRQARSRSFVRSTASAARSGQRRERSRTD